MNQTGNLKKMVRISVLGVIAFLLMLIEIPLLFITPEFLKIDLSDLPALVASFAMGPVAGILVELLKNILKIMIRSTNTAFVGELANFAVGAIYVGIAGYIYRKNKTKSSRVKGLVIGAVAMSIIASLLNYFILIPMYAELFGVPLDGLIAMASKINKSIVDLKSFIIFGVLPFNLIKGLLLGIVGYPIYSRIKKAVEE